jgi:hypothetical protein
MEVSSKLRIPGSFVVGRGPSLAIEEEAGLVQGRKSNTIPPVFQSSARSLNRLIQSVFLSFIGCFDSSDKKNRLPGTAGLKETVLFRSSSCFLAIYLYYYHNVPLITRKDFLCGSHQLPRWIRITSGKVIIVFPFVAKIVVILCKLVNICSSPRKAKQLTPI